MCACVCVCVRARKTFRVWIRAWQVRFVSRFFSRVCACVGVRARIGARVGWGGVQGRRYFWARAHRLASTYTPGTQRDKLFTFTTTPRLFTTPLYHEPKGISCLPQPLYHTPLPLPKASLLPQGCLAYMGAVCFSLGYLVGSCLLGYLFSWLPYWVLFGWGGWGCGGGVFFWQGCFSARLGNGLFFGRFPSLAVPCPIGAFSFVYELPRLGMGLIHAFRCWVGSIGFI